MEIDWSEKLTYELPKGSFTGLPGAVRRAGRAMISQLLIYFYTITMRCRLIPAAVDRRYKPQRVIGIGAYGIVCAAKDELTHQLVAIKKVPL